MTEHARHMVAERQLDLSWIRTTIENPVKTEDDKEDSELRHALCEIPERGGRILRVVYNDRTRPWRIVTAYFDRREGKGR
ncbi:MAG: DUF4258 domain-containing protein [Deltaproteobacteria bacterium]|nr:DUF4258 domain-containing protein [Deltaproteobacteria bacterium]